MRRTWTSVKKAPPLNTAVELRFADGSSDLAMWIGTRWLPDPPQNHHPEKWRPLPLPLPLFDEGPLPTDRFGRVA